MPVGLVSLCWWLRPWSSRLVVRLWGSPARPRQRAVHANWPGAAFTLPGAPRPGRAGGRGPGLRSARGGQADRCLRTAGYEVPEISRVMGAYGIAGGGCEIQFPPEFIKVIQP